MTENLTQHEPNVAYKSLLYWRKNLWNGSSCVPIILALEAGVVSMKTADGVIVFSAPTSELLVKFTGWGTMLLTIAGTRYDIVGMPAADSPAVSASQIEELRQLDDASSAEDVKTTSVENLIATSTIGADGANIAGAAASTRMYYRGLSSIHGWKALIGSAADQKKKLNNMTYFIILVIVGVFIALALK